MRRRTPSRRGVTAEISEAPLSVLDARKHANRPRCPIPVIPVTSGSGPARAGSGVFPCIVGCRVLRPRRGMRSSSWQSLKSPSCQSPQGSWSTGLGLIHSPGGSELFSPALGALFSGLSLPGFGRSQGSESRRQTVVAWGLLFPARPGIVCTVRRRRVPVGPGVPGSSCGEIGARRGHESRAARDT